jgi:anti-sigma regulatory factor (Ser/Thr protein kinase)
VHLNDARIALRPERDSARSARRFIESVLAEWDLARLRETSELLVTELVTNAVLHARTDVDLVARRSGPGLRVEVHDGDHTPPVPRPYSPMSPGGRGLRIVDALAERWGVEPTAGGKYVWFELRRDPLRESRDESRGKPRGHRHEDPGHRDP